jgi:hypothetical protein
LCFEVGLHDLHEAEEVGVAQTEFWFLELNLDSERFPNRFLLVGLLQQPGGGITDGVGSKFSVDLLGGVGGPSDWGEKEEEEEHLDFVYVCVYIYKII